jgi:hypothetical protein
LGQPVRKQIALNPPRDLQLLLYARQRLFVQARVLNQQPCVFGQLPFAIRE